MAQVAQQPTRDVDAEQVRDVLRKVIDPEVGINIVDLGLIYAIETSGAAIRVRMTMTTPSCPMGGMMADEVRTVIANRFRNRRIEVDLVWEPRWQPDMISQIARLQLGLAK